MIKLLLKNVFRFIFLVLLQVLVLNNIQFSGYINPYLYVLFILLMPFETPGWLLLISGFFLGLSIDLFSGTVGMHTAATVFMAFLRPYVLNLIAPRDGYETGTYPRLYSYGLEWFLKYSLILVFLHHLVLFYLEIFKFDDFFLTLLRAILSTLFTVILILFSQIFFYKS